jgi:hypothetical protein
MEGELALTRRDQNDPDVGRVTSLLPSLEIIYMEAIFFSGFRRLSQMLLSE